MLTITSPPLKGAGGCLYKNNYHYKLSTTKNNYAKNRNPRNLGSLYR